MMKVLRSLVAAILFPALVSAQADYIHESWDPAPTLHSLPSPLLKESAVIIMNRRRVEYIDGQKGEVIQLYTEHQLVHVNDEKGIEEFNTIYLGAANSIEVVDIKARAILPGGRLVEIDKKNIKDLTEQDGSVYKIFAVEGLEKGCELEFFYTYKKEPTYFGRINLQGRHYLMHTEFELACPERLIFDLKPYNVLLHVSDTTVNEKHIYRVSNESVRSLEDEKYASYQVNLQRVEYKLSYNSAKGKGQRLFTWNEFAKRVYTRYTEFSEKELAAVKNFVNKSGWSNTAAPQEKITRVENYLKKNFATREDVNSDDAENMEWVLKNKIASYAGIMRLYGAIFKETDVEFQFVYAADRDDKIIDKSFENWNNCEKPIFYFPQLRKYMAPTELDYRFPFIQPSWGAAYGVYCKPTSIGTFNTAIAEIKPINLEDFAQSYTLLESKVEMNETNDSLVIDMRQSYAGYRGVYYRASYNYSNEEEKRNMQKALEKFGTNSENALNSEFLNTEMESINTNKPFVFHTKVKSSELVEQAGKKILVKLGEVIGPQVEMYQEKPRQLPAVMDYPHFEERSIEFTIPAGYTVKNLKDLNLEHVYKENGETTMGFSSTYTLSGNVLKVHIMEEYRRTVYPMEQFEEFRKIINTSADFNKIILVLEKS